MVVQKTVYKNINHVCFKPNILTYSNEGGIIISRHDTTLPLKKKSKTDQ